MKTVLRLALATTLFVVLGCDNTKTPDTDVSGVEPADNQYLMASQPDKVVPVGMARQYSNSGDTVAIEGRIGGSVEPFVNGIAAFTIVDPEVPYCAPSEGCLTPWDYCCTQDQVKHNIATVKIVDDQGNPLSKDAKQLLGVKGLSLVVVEGTAKRDEQGNLSILAEQVFVKEQ